MQRIVIISGVALVALAGIVIYNRSDAPAAQESRGGAAGASRSRSTSRSWAI